MARGNSGKPPRRHPTRASGVLPPRLSPTLWAALLGAVTTIALASPVYAQPVAVPDTGSRPVPAGGLRLPGTGPTAGPSTPSTFVPSVTDGPLVAQIYTGETEVALLGEQLLALQEDEALAAAELTEAEQALREARTALLTAQRDAESAAALALKDAAAMPPGEYGGDLHGLGALSRLQRGLQPEIGADAANRDVSLAAAAEQAAYLAYQEALTRLDSLRTQFGTVEGTYKQRETALLALKARNTEQMVTIERQREAVEQEIGQSIGSDGIASTTAHPRAVAALQFALRQLGKPYLWGAEGPSRYDCSGLMWAAYRSPGADYFSLPRVAKDQYYATRGNTVTRSALLPGDLIFFASGSSWTSIHHVGMYVGDGKMVHAPTTGDVVKVSTVWWSRFYAATRVIREVPAPTVPGTPTPTPTTPVPTPVPTTPTPAPTTPGPKPTTPGPTPTTPGPTPTTPGPTPTTPGPTPTTPAPTTPAPTTPPPPSPLPTPTGPDPTPTTGPGTPDPEATGTGTPTSTPSGTASNTVAATPNGSGSATGSPSAGALED
ncbi:C40 family peptidase [Solwaraspora sp. WMMD406]|uniref:C40 family peptidase n=1 Tax=Solwaraspora sp. WMMD406 TaxID=3016095 RepID=UPI0024173638|nr:C40 family peptidase [Solwaraspora sp. WMMD406]MDG4763261.1 C40 family peptidase [Solwaraspora sp. WMMD406]